MIPTFDIEAINWVNPTAVGFYDGEEYYEFIKENEADDVIWRFLCFLREFYPGLKVYAHFASRYDNKILLASLCKHGEAASLEAGLVRLKWKDPDISFEDSYPILPMSLKKLTKTFKVTEKGSWDHKVQLQPWELGKDLPTFKHYLKVDCLSLSQAIYKLCEMLGYNFKVMPSISLPTTSVKAFNKGFYSVDKINDNEPFEDFIREATYGGRNEVYKRYGQRINQYDVRSMYVSCYDTPIPVGRMSWIRGNIDRGTLAEAKVQVPKDFTIGPLPLRIYGRLTFPVGEFQSWWDTRELREAAEQGADVTILRQLECEELPILKEFGEYVSKLRGGPQDEFWKMFGLAVSGKFGQSRWRDITKHFSEIKNMEGYTPLDKDELYFQTKEYTKKLPYIKPAVSMRIRAEARVRHLRFLMRALETGEIFYGDTDSIFTTSELPTGKKVGQLTYLGQAERGYFIKQKLYALIQKGRLKQRSAGFSDLKLDENSFKRLLRGEDILKEKEDLSNFKSILKEQEVKLVTRSRVIAGKMGDSRIPLGIDTRPIELPKDMDRFRVLPSPSSHP